MSKFTPAFKAKVAIEAIKENSTIESLAKRYELSPSKITEWKDEFLKNASQAFEKPSDSKRDLKKVKQENDRLLHKIGQLSIDCDFFCKSLRECRTQSEIADLENLRPAGMSRNKFCKYTKFNRSTLYYRSKGESSGKLLNIDLNYASKQSAELRVIRKTTNRKR